MTLGRRTYLFYPVLIVSGYLLNFCWESVHGLLYRAHQELPASVYVPMMAQAALLDALWITGMQLCVALYARSRSWGFSVRSVLLFSAAGMLPAMAVEYVAVFRLHLWAYAGPMPTLFGIGVSPLLQMPITGFAAVAAARAAAGSER